jgi:hypothetical protein
MTAATTRLPGTFRIDTGTPVSFPAARECWAEAARETLLCLARAGTGTTTYGELAEEVQRATGIRTRVIPRNWIGGVLALVGDECRRRAEPPLPCLCLRADGTMGKGYSGATGPELEKVAARDRAACYRHFGSRRESAKPPRRRAIT